MKRQLISALLSVAISLAPASAAAGEYAPPRRPAATAVSVKIETVAFEKGLRFDYAKAVFGKVASGTYGAPIPIYFLVLAVSLPFAAIGAIIDLLSTPFRRTEKCTGTVSGILSANNEPLRGEDVWIGVPRPDIVDDRKWLIQQPYMVKTDGDGKFALRFDLRFGPKKMKTLELRSLSTPARELIFKLEGDTILFADSEPYSTAVPTLKVWSK